MVKSHIIKSQRIKSVEWRGGVVRLLDQTRLPRETAYIDCTEVETLVEAIKSLRVRGAPAIGIAAAYGIALAAQKSNEVFFHEFSRHIESVCHLLASSRPTAVNLFWAIRRMQGAMRLHADQPTAWVKESLLAEADAILAEDIAANRTMGDFGSALIQTGDGVLTHCNTGAIATGGYGTALGVIRSAWGQGKEILVYATESRPMFQGARLTAWELKEEGIPVRLMTDSMAGFFMKRGQIQCVVVGADRIARNGDVANKIGTYTLAVLASVHGIPFYVVAPTASIDVSIATGDEITIEERSPEEITHFQGIPIAPEGVQVLNPAFDVTPAAYISAIITEKGVFQPDQISTLPL